MLVTIINSKHDVTSSMKLHRCCNHLAGFSIHNIHSNHHPTELSISIDLKMFLLLCHDTVELLQESRSTRSPAVREEPNRRD
ncbi:hypothetical protein PBY51_013444 [Eleginops maclovinus]|uniref:Uncharacterized protein n=1 Tax=Eleginops maclovinus TaxID=56733 RepID=A0AAN8AUG4_ELEMC|nr:hypothetical protein PBY51_013444 [Eleginops maclovinus]